MFIVFSRCSSISPRVGGDFPKVQNGGKYLKRWNVFLGVDPTHSQYADCCQANSPGEDPLVSRFGLPTIMISSCPGGLLNLGSAYKTSGQFSAYYLSLNMCYFPFSFLQFKPMVLPTAKETLITNTIHYCYCYL